MTGHSAGGGEKVMTNETLKKKKRVDALGFSRDRNLRRLVFPGLIITYSFVLRKLNEKNTREGGIHSPNHLI